MEKSLSDLVSSSPRLVRKLIRNGKLKGNPTTAYSEGYKQANVAIIPAKYSQDFLNFTKLNSGALPLLYHSRPDEFSASQLCEDSDIRTDLPLFLKLIKGEVCESLENLEATEVSGYVTFYLGCSFSFNKILITNGILKNLENNIKRNVSMYRTNLANLKSGRFGGNMVVSMRYIHRDYLSFVTQLTYPLSDVHGAPIHYGNPKRIGIMDIDKPDYGDFTAREKNEVAVFWCCGVTGLEAIKSANLDLAFTHAPGCMFITDIKQDAQSTVTAPICHVIEFKPDMYGVVSDDKLRNLKNLYKIASQDIGNRGINSLVIDGDFEKACLALSYAKTVALTTGFPVNENPFDETDGLPGIITLSAILSVLNKHITLICDDHNYELYTQIIQKCVDKNLLKSMISVECGTKVNILNSDETTPRFDVMFATERSGRASDSRYYSMKGRDLTSRVTSRIDDLFTEAGKRDDVTTIGVGDGGNELGMGKVGADVIGKSIQNGSLIASVTSTDLLLACGVSNWGCQALAFGLVQLMACPYHERHQRRAVGHVTESQFLHNWIPTIDREREILSIVESFGVKDGISPKNVMSVDGMKFECEHKDILNQMSTEISH